LDVAEIELWRNALRVQVEGKINQINVARALAIAEKTTFDAVSTS
jgi:hypothetical protein